MADERVGTIPDPLLLLLRTVIYPAAVSASSAQRSLANFKPSARVAGSLNSRIQVLGVASETVVMIRFCRR